MLHRKLQRSIRMWLSAYFREQGEQVEIIKLNGSIELAPMIGLADRIVDIVSTGRTLVENGLVEYERIVDITSRLIVNPVSYRMKDARISEIVERIAAVLEEKSKLLISQVGSESFGTMVK